MADEFTRLVSGGLTFVNLLRLYKLCDERFDENPALYWPLSQIFAELKMEYDDQGIPMERFEVVNRTLGPPLLDIFASDHSSSV
jgi:hypothetical protein